MQLYEQDQNEVQTPVSTLLPLLPWLSNFQHFNLNRTWRHNWNEKKKKSFISQTK